MLIHVSGAAQIDQFIKCVLCKAQGHEFKSLGAMQSQAWEYIYNPPVQDYRQKQENPKKLKDQLA